MPHHRTQLLSDICDFLDRFHLSAQILDFEITEHINQYLEPFWRGSTSKIDWELISTNVQKVDFPCHVPIDAELTQQLLQHANFRALQHTEIILYFLGMQSCLLLKSAEFPRFIFDLMNDFCHLDTFFIFAAPPILAQKQIADFLEIQLFDYFCGQI